MAFESLVLSELPSLSGSSQITVWWWRGVYDHISVLTRKGKRGGSITEHTVTAKPNRAKSAPPPLTFVFSPSYLPRQPSQTVLRKNLNRLKLKEKET